MQACAYLLLIVLLVQFLLSQLLRTNICALLLPVGVLVAELLVGETPDLKGILLFSASCIFWTVGKHLPLRRQLAAVALWSVLFVAVSHIFTAPAQELAAAISTQESETQTGTIETQTTESETQPESQIRDEQPETQMQSAPEESQIAEAAESAYSDSTGADAADEAILCYDVYKTVIYMGFRR